MGQEYHQLRGVINNLLSAAFLCNAGCKVFCHPTECEIKWNGKVILWGWRDYKTRLWWVSLVDDNNDVPELHPENTVNYNNLPYLFCANSIYKYTNTRQIILFYHATLLSPVKDNWFKAIGTGYLWGWTSITAAIVYKYIKFVDATKKGHLKHRRQGIQSTTKSQPHTSDHMDVNSKNLPMTELTWYSWPWKK